MKKLLCICFMIILLAGISACREAETYAVSITTAVIAEPALPVHWQGWAYGQACAQRDRAMDNYSRTETDGSDLIQSTEGSAIIGYYDESKQLQVIEITVYREIGRSILRFYPFEDAVAIKSEDVWYTAPFSEVTQEDQYLDGTARMSIENGQLYYYIDEREPMYLSNNTWYAEIYAKAVDALNAH